MAELALLLAGWLPLWALALFCRQRLRPGRLLMGAALAGFVGGMCTVELRRHGLQSATVGAPAVPFIDLRLDEVLHYAFLGAAGSLLIELALDRLGRKEELPAPGAGAEE